MYKIDQSLIPQQLASSGDPLLGAAGSLVGGAIGGSIGGPMGASLGSSLGGQLAGQGTVDLEKTAIAATQGAAGNALMGGMESVIDGASTSSLASPMMEQGVDPSIANTIASQQKEGFRGGLSGIASKLFSMGGKVGPLAAVTYKQDGGQVNARFMTEPTGDDQDYPPVYGATQEELLYEQEMRRRKAMMEQAQIEAARRQMMNPLARSITEPTGDVGTYPYIKSR